MDYNDVSTYNMQQAHEEQVESFLDQQRNDLHGGGGAVEVLRYQVEDEIPDREVFKEFRVTTSKMPSTTFLEKEDYTDAMLEFDKTVLIWSMKIPRSERTVHEMVAEAELRQRFRFGLKRSVGFTGSKTNTSTLAATVIRQNVHSFQDDGGSQSSGGIRGKLGKMFKMF
jgi:hypothetical protein